MSKYLDLPGLSSYHTQITNYIDTGLSGKLGNTDTAYRTTAIPMGAVDSTSTSTAFTATITGITELYDGVCVWLKNGVVTSEAGYTIDINNLGAKPVYNSNAAATQNATWFNINYTVLLIYNSARVEGGCWDYVVGYNSDTTYSPVKLGFGYTTCSTAEATLAKVASLNSYALTTGGIVSIRFSNNVPANSTLNINSKGAKAIYFKNAAITDGIIKAGDTATFIYSTAYRLISIDRWADKQDAITSANKLSADLVDDTSTTNKFVTSTDITNWNTKVDGPSSSTADNIATFNDATGKVIKDSGYTIATSVPANALFTDEKVKQTNSTTNATYNVLFSSSSSTTTEKTEGTKKSANLTFNPSTKELKVGGTALGTAAFTASTDYATSSHTHGNITNAGALQTDDITIANGDKLVVTDSSDSNKIARTSLSFDGSTATQALTKKGTWENFTNDSKTATDGGTDLSLVTTGEKYTWNNKQDALTRPVTGAATWTASNVITVTNASSGNVIKSSGVAIATSSTGVTDVDTKVPTSKSVKTYVDTAINNLPEPMIFKGEIVLTTDSSDYSKCAITTPASLTDVKVGWTYKVSSILPYNDGTDDHAYTGNIKVGDTLIANKANPNSNPEYSSGSPAVYDWVLVPSGDEPSGTVTSVTPGIGLTTSSLTPGSAGDAITGSGTLDLKLKDSTVSTLAATTRGTTSSREYPLGLDKNGDLSVNVPWTDAAVKQTSTTESSYNKDYAVTFSVTAASTTSTKTEGLRKNATAFKYNPYTSALTVTGSITTGTLNATNVNGIGYATCNTAESTTAKTATLTDYILTHNGYVSVYFTNAVPAGSTLNINSKGAKTILYNNAAILDDMIRAGETVTFIYDSTYNSNAGAYRLIDCAITDAQINSLWS